MTRNRTASADRSTLAAIKDLRRIPGIGPSLARDLLDLGIQRVESLRRRNPEQLYEKLCALRGVHQDRCVLYAFRCAVHFATDPNGDPELLKWWNWHDSKFPGSLRGPRLSRNRKATG